MVSALGSGSSGPGCVLGQDTLLSLSLSTQVYKCELNAGGNPTKD